MFFILSKILNIFLVPFFWILALLIYSVFTSARRKNILLIISLVALYFYSTDFIVTYLLKKLEYPCVWYKDVKPEYEAAIVLGGMAAPGKMPDDRTHFPGSPDRLLHAMQLYKLGKVKNIIISGGSGELTGDRIAEAEYLKKTLTLCEVPDSVIFIENKSKNTHENATFSKSLTDSIYKSENSRFLLVTSAWHMKRSIRCFQKESMNVTPFSVDSQLSGKPLSFNSFIPNYQNISKWQIIIHEYFGYLMYKISGYI